MNCTVASAALLLARVLFVADFVLYGSQKFNNPQIIAKLIEAHHLPGALVYAVIPLQLGGSPLLLLGLQTRLAALGLGIFCLLAPSIFWLNDLGNLSRDYAAAGGFVLLFLFGPGNWSLDALIERDLLATALKPLFESGALTSFMIAAARVLVAFPFLADVANKLLHPATITAPMYVGLPLELAGGLALIAGYRTALAAAALLAWSLFSGLVLHWPPFADSFASTYKIAGRGPFVSFMKDLTTWATLLVVLALLPPPPRAKFGQCRLIGTPDG